MTKLIGFDVSTRVCAGFIIEDGEKYSTIEIAGKPGDEANSRIDYMFLTLVNYIKKSKPTCVFAENSPYLMNIKVTLQIHSVVSAVRFACALNEVPFQTVEVTSWKKAFCGNGRAEKSQIAQIAKLKYGEKLLTNQDLCDASGVASFGWSMIKK